VIDGPHALEQLGLRSTVASGVTVTASP